MFRDQVNSPLSRGSNGGPIQSNINGILSHFLPAISNLKLRSELPIARSSDPLLPAAGHKRTQNADDQSASVEEQATKRMKPEVGLVQLSLTTSHSLTNEGAQSNSSLDQNQLRSTNAHEPKQMSNGFPHASIATDSEVKITLPSLNDALAGFDNKSTEASTVPAVSQSYFDTYKPHDENWRYGMLDTIRKTKPSDSISSLGTALKPKLPSIQELNSRDRPLFDSRVGHKGLPAFPVRKINFPYESNYTYLNQTYMKDVEHYPEYLELAQSLVLLSRPQPQTSPLVYAYNLNTSRNPGLRIQPPNYRQHHAPQLHPPTPQFAGFPQDAHINKSMVQHGLPTPQLATFSTPAYMGSHGYIPLPKSATLPGISQIAYGTPDSSFEMKPPLPTELNREQQMVANGASVRTRFIPITPPSVKNKTRSELMKSPSRVPPALPRMCISCGSDLSPCWRPSWSPKEGQLCNSCGLRYKKTAARCLNPQCRKIPAKGEWASMVSKGMALYDGVEAYSCLGCGYKVETR